VVIWIYYSMAALLFGAEVVAALHRSEAVFTRRVTGGRILPFKGDTRLLLEVPTDWVFFQEGETGEEMFFVLSGRVMLQEGRKTAVIGQGQAFGEATFLLGKARSATAVALEPCRCVIIHGHNFEALLLEFPEIVKAMLVTMALRLNGEKG
jgi:CRP-like cAMP-binding protein